MQRPIIFFLLLVLVCGTCVGQQSIGPTSREIADFAFDLYVFGNPVVRSCYRG
jgi:hypothetical protein